MLDFIYNPETRTMEILGVDNIDEDEYAGYYAGVLHGFTYNGIYSGDLHVDYIPDASDLWFVGTDWNVYDTDVAWHNGGYYYGNSAKKKEFTLKCFFEEITIKQREQIRHWLHRNTEGRLIFDDMSFVYWDVRPTKLVTGELYLDTDGKYSGTFTVTFTAYNPFGYLTRKANDGTETDSAYRYCNLIDQSLMPAAPTTSSRQFDVYNAGTEACGMTIRLKGSTSNPIMFLNDANQTKCILSSLPTNNLYLDVNGDTGFVSTYIVQTGTIDNGFAYHDRGVVRLEPSELMTDVEYVNAGLNGTLRILAISGMRVSENMISRKVIFDDVPTLYGYVRSVNIANNQLLCAMSGSGTVPDSGKCSIYVMNHIEILEKNSNNAWVTPTTLNLTSLEIDYNPRIF